MTKHDPGGRPTLYRGEYCQQLIEHMSQGKSYESFAGVCRVSIQTLYEWEQTYEGFSEAKKVARAMSLKTLEEMALAGMTGQMRRLVRETVIMIEKDGQRVPALDKDGNVLYNREYGSAPFNALTWIFIMRNRFPDLYKDVRALVIADRSPPVRKEEPTAEEKLQEIRDVQEMIKEVEDAKKLVTRGTKNKPGKGAKVDPG